MTDENTHDRARREVVEDRADVAHVARLRARKQIAAAVIVVVVIAAAIALVLLVRDTGQSARSSASSAADSAEGLRAAVAVLERRSLIVEYLADADTYGRCVDRLASHRDAAVTAAVTGALRGENDAQLEARADQIDEAQARADHPRAECGPPPPVPPVPPVP